MSCFEVVLRPWDKTLKPNKIIRPVSTYFSHTKLTYYLIVTLYTKHAIYSEAATAVVLKKKVFLEISQNSQESTCARDPFSIKAQVFSWEFFEISTNTFFTERLRTTASVYCRMLFGTHTKRNVDKLYFH